MPKLNRRRFLQVVTAASLTPMMPAFSASAATAAPTGLTASQMLWGSLQARAGSAQKLGGLTRSMGISTKATQGIYAKVIQNHALTAHGAGSLARIARPAPAPVTATSAAKATRSKPIEIDLERLLGDDTPDEVEFVENPEIDQTED